MSISSNTLATSLSPSPIPSPRPSVTCTDVIKACDKALADKDRQIKISDLALKESQDESKKLAEEVKHKDEQLSSIFRNPYFLIGVGIVGGLFLFKR